jgi:predicted transcriptional regulator
MRDINVSEGIVPLGEFRPRRRRSSFLEAVAEGIDDSEAGRVVDHKKVRRWLESWGTDREKDAPK